MLLCTQICVLESANRSPFVTEYSVSGTTYAPEGTIFDTTGVQVLLFYFSCFCIHAQAEHTSHLKLSNY